MADNRKLYTVELAGIGHTMLLSSEDAARYGASAVEVKQGTPANKSRTALDKSAK